MSARLRRDRPANHAQHAALPLPAAGSAPPASLADHDGPSPADRAQIGVPVPGQADDRPNAAASSTFPGGALVAVEASGQALLTSADGGHAALGARSRWSGPAPGAEGRRPIGGHGCLETADAAGGSRRLHADGADWASGSPLPHALPDATDGAAELRLHVTASADDDAVLDGARLGVPAAPPAGVPTRRVEVPASGANGPAAVVARADDLHLAAAPARLGASALVTGATDSAAFNPGR